MSHPVAPQGAIESLLAELVPTVVAEPGPQRGQPSAVPGAMLWAGMLTCILRGEQSQRAIWRLLTVHGLWHWPRVETLSDDAIYRRLARTGPAPLERIWTALTAHLVAAADQAEPVPTPARPRLAAFAREIVALDETTLDQVRRQGAKRDVPRGDDRRIPGKITAVFDVRRQLFRRVRIHDDFRENEKVPAAAMLSDLPAHSLILTDLGYFSFPFYDGLINANQDWIARLRDKTSVIPVHCFWEQAGSGEWLVWLGAYRADKAGHLVRLIMVKRGTTTYRYLTSVRDPRRLSAQEVVALYGRRWDIELAFNTLKTDLGLAVLWSTHWPVIQTQIWAVLTIAQAAFHLRLLVAEAAGVDLFDVSLPLLVREAPRFLARGENPVTVIPRLGTAGGIIRKSRRTPYEVPVPATMASPPNDLVTVREARYAGRRCGPGGTDRRPYAQ